MRVKRIPIPQRHRAFCYATYLTVKKERTGLKLYKWRLRLSLKANMSWRQLVSQRERPRHRRSDYVGIHGHTIIGTAMRRYKRTVIIAHSPRANSDIPF